MEKIKAVKESVKSERFRNRVEIAIVVVVAGLILSLGFQAAGWVKDQAALTRQLHQWALQQQELQLRAAQQQGLVQPPEPQNDNSGAGEDVGSGTAPRR